MLNSFVQKHRIIGVIHLEQCNVAAASPRHRGAAPMASMLPSLHSETLPAPATLCTASLYIAAFAIKFLIFFPPTPTPSLQWWEMMSLSALRAECAFLSPEILSAASSADSRRKQSDGSAGRGNSSFWHRINSPHLIAPIRCWARPLPEWLYSPSTDTQLVSAPSASADAQRWWRRGDPQQERLQKTWPTSPDGSWLAFQWDPLSSSPLFLRRDGKCSNDVHFCCKWKHEGMNEKGYTRSISCFPPFLFEAHLSMICSTTELCK